MSEVVFSQAKALQFKTMLLQVQNAAIDLAQKNAVLESENAKLKEALEKLKSLERIAPYDGNLHAHVNPEGSLVRYSDLVEVIQFPEQALTAPASEDKVMAMTKIAVTFV